MLCFYAEIKFRKYKRRNTKKHTRFLLAVTIKRSQAIAINYKLSESDGRIIIRCWCIHSLEL